MAKLSVSAFLEKAGRLPVIDVRSPAEFAEGHLPGACNIPLFDNEERKQVGTTYKQQSKEAAVLLGLELVGPKMRPFVEQARQLAPDGNILVHCWRGGMRSESFAWLLQTAGMQADTLTGGYKAYRTHLRASFEQATQLIVLTGETGSGKTAILQALATMGEQVINLEDIARHKGSAFGGIGMQAQPSTEQFHNNLYAAWCRLNLRQRIWIEDESFCIGQVKLPPELWNKMAVSPIVKVSVPRADRIQRLVAEYGILENKALQTAILTIQKRLGGLQTQQALQALEDQRFDVVADILLYYYDKSYHRCLSKKSDKIIADVAYAAKNPATYALQITKAVENALSNL